MHLDAPTCSESLPERTCQIEPPEHVPRTSARAQTSCGVRVGSLRATEPRAWGKTRGRKRKKCRRVKKKHYIYMYYNVPLRNVLTWNPGGDASWKRTRRQHSSSHSLFMLGETWQQKQQDRSSCWVLQLIFALNICISFVIALVSEAVFGLKKASNWSVLPKTNAVNVSLLR